MTDVATYAQRRRELLKKTPHLDRILVVTHAQQYQTHDVEHVYRAGSHMRYLCGWEHPSSILCIRRDRSCLYKRSCNPLWNDDPETDGKEERVDEVRNLLDFSLVNDERVCRISDARTFNPDIDRAHACVAHVPIDAVAFATLCDMRLVKTPAEIAQIERACAITALAMDYAHSLATRCSERVVVASILRFFAMCGVREAFPPIVAYDAHTCRLHWRGHGTTGPPRARVLIDIGADVEGYASDMTRTRLFDSNDEAVRVLATVDEAHEKALECCTIGSDLAAVEDAARAVLNRERAHYHCPHAIVHWVGLDVHDVGARSRPFEAGMCLAIEPGLYRGGDGARTEDTVLITDEGPRVLTRARASAEFRSALLRSAQR